MSLKVLKWHAAWPLTIICLFLTSCHPSPPTIPANYSHTAHKQRYVAIGIASWYGPNFHGKRTANGERYNMYKLTAAHRTLPFNTRLLVTNLQNRHQVVVRINDRGPFIKNRIIDLSYAAAQKLGLIGPGTARVKLETFNDIYQKGPFYIQIGSFKIKKNALRVLANLKKNYPSSRIQTYTSGKQIFFRVQAGKFATMYQAKTCLSKLCSNNRNNCFVIAN